jgi:Tfp pilus assembly protein FimT
MKKNLLVMVLLAIILAMAVPLTNYFQQSDNAFTYNNIISFQPGINN